MSHQPSGKKLSEFFGEYSKTKDTIAQVLATLSRDVAERIKDKYPEKVFALIQLQKRYKERK